MLKEVNISELRVSQTNLFNNHYDKYISLNLDELLACESDNQIDAWEVNGEVILADKHHRIATAYEKGCKTYFLEISNKEDPYFEMIFEGVVQPEYEQAQKAQVYTIPDLLEQEKL